MNKIYYWAGFYRLESGSVVKAGNWGRILNLTRIDTNAINIFREQLLENIRLQHYPHRPSRMKSVFLCPSLEEIKKYLQHPGKVFDKVYEVELIDSEAPVFETDWNFYGMQQVQNTLQWTELAHLYWKGENPAFKEVVSESDIRIIRCLD